MDEIKIENFRRTGSGQFPTFVALHSDRCRELLRKVAVFCKMPADTDGLGLVSQLVGMSTVIEVLDESACPVDLYDMLKSQGIHPFREVFVNWDRFRTIDSIGLADLSEYFFDIWYPSSDDIDIFDESVSWVMSVSHHGTVSIAKSS